MYQNIGIVKLVLNLKLDAVRHHSKRIGAAKLKPLTIAISFGRAVSIAQTWLERALLLMWLCIGALG